MRLLSTLFAMTGMGLHHLLTKVVEKQFGMLPVLKHGSMVEEQLRALLAAASELSIQVYS